MFAMTKDEWLDHLEWTMMMGFWLEGLSSLRTTD